MFDQEKAAQTVVNLAKDYTAANLQMMRTTTEQFERTMHVLIKQGATVQDEGTKLFVDWCSRAKQGQQQYYNLMEDGIKNIEGLFGASDSRKKTEK